MKLEFIGTGGAFDVHLGNSSAILTWKNKKILIDCGHTVFPTLLQNDLVRDLDNVMITHLHDDHAGSLSTLIFYCYFFRPDKKLTLWVPKEFQKEIKEFLSFSLKNVYQFIEIEEVPREILVINTTGMHYPNMQTYGFVFEENQERIAYSGDLNHPDFLFQELQKLDKKNTIVFHDISFSELAKAAHAFYKDVEKHLSDFQVFGYHCNQLMKPSDCKIPLVREHKEFLSSFLQ